MRSRIIESPNMIYRESSEVHHASYPSYPDWEERSSKAAHSDSRGCGAAGPEKSECGLAATFGIERNAGVELALDEADRAAVLTAVRYSAQEVFSRARGRIQGHKA